MLRRGVVTLHEERAHAAACQLESHCQTDRAAADDQYGDAFHAVTEVIAGFWSRVRDPGCCQPIESGDRRPRRTPWVTGFWMTLNLPAPP
jgi:hypothetical protein